MKVIFLKAGKYRDDISTIAVSASDVEAKTVFDISADRAMYFKNAGLVEIPGEVSKKKPDAEEFKEVPKPKKTTANKK